MIMLNQVGYNPKQKKWAAVQYPGRYRVKNEKGDVVTELGTKAAIQDPLSGETIYPLEFTKLTAEGKYYLEYEYGDISKHFEIKKDAYREVHNAMIKALYFQRCGCALEEKHAGVFKHAACHTDMVSLWSDNAVTFECNGGWHDAGDYGRYITPAAVTIAHLLYAYKNYPMAFTDELNIPESGNGVADVLNECRYELEWMLKMQREDGGVYHKLTSRYHVAFIMPEEDKDPFYAYDVSSMAVADFCACMALSARVYKGVDAEFAAKMEAAARKAWAWLEENATVYFKNPKDSGTGEYGDFTDNDERLWAAAEMFYLAVEKGEDATKYKESVASLLHAEKISYDFGWTDVSGFALMAVLTDKEKLMGEAIYNDCKEIVLAEAERLLGLCKNNAFALAMDAKDFCWGSCMVVTNRGILLSLAYELTGKETYAQVVQNQLDYLLGKNATGYSFVTGFGEGAYKFPHSRPLDADGIEEPVLGLVSGGPNRRPADPIACELIPKGTAPMKCFVDRMESYSTNEITIYWNSSAVYVTAFLRR